MPRPPRSSHRRAAHAAGGAGALLVLTGCVVPAPGDVRAVPPVLAPTLREHGDDVPDGTWTASGTYETPGGAQRLDVTVTLDDGEVRALRVDPAAVNSTSRRFQERFASAVVDEVVGLPLADVQVDRLAGSSSTGRGFMAALEAVVRGARG